MSVAYPTPAPAQVDFNVLVNDTSDAFERSRRVQVMPDARDELIGRTVGCETIVGQELQSGKITLGKLTDDLTQVLDNALDIAKAQNQNFIDRPVVIKSMDRYCPYLFWC